MRVFLPIPNFPSHLVSDNGMVKSVLTGRVSFGTTNSYGYKIISTTNRDKKTKQFQVHRAVYLAFVGDIPEGYSINHLDGNKSNNNLHNLECVTPSQNSIHAVSTGLQPNILRPSEVLEVLNLFDSGIKDVRDISSTTGISVRNVSHILHGKTFLSVSKYPRLVGSAKGSRNAFSKLDENKVLEIRKMFKGGLKHREIAVKFGVGWTAIQKVVSGKTWGHVGG